MESNSTAAMTIAGLHKLAHTKFRQVQWNRTKASSPHTDPRDAHQANETAKRLEEEAKAHASHIKDNTDLILNIESLISHLNNSDIKSAHRTLALRDLESASDRLRRELGTPVKAE